MRALELSGLAIGQGWVSGKLSNCPGPCVPDFMELATS